MALSIKGLLAVNFASRPFEQQLQIVSLGKPLPLITRPVMCEQVQWLTFCEETCDFVCWPCLLFMPSSSTTKIKISNLKERVPFEAAITDHEITGNHMACSLKLQLFISENFQPPVSTKDKVGYNNAVMKNNEILRYITDAICCVVGQKQFNSDGGNSCNMISLKDCKNFLQLIKDCHPRKVDVVDGAVDLLNSNPQIVNDLVDAMTRSVKMSIKNETRKSTYVSIILSQHRSSRTKIQMSTILRYINQGKVCERFTGFTNYAKTDGLKSKEQLMQHILSSLKEYDIEERYLALSLDGELLHGQLLSLLITSICISYPYTYFVPWHSHGFGRVLLQTLSVHNECGLFLKMISGMQDFFRGENHFKSLDVLLRRKIPDYSKSASVRWNLHSNFVIHVAKYRWYFIEFFGTVVRNSRCQKSGVVAQAVAYISFLREFRTAFLLKLFHEIFSPDFDETFNFRLEGSSDAFNPVRISQFKARVAAISLARIQQALEVDALREIGKKINLLFQVRRYEELLRRLIRHVCAEVDFRCTHLSTRLRFCDLFDALREVPSDAPASKCCFSDRFRNLLRQLMVEHGQYFAEYELTKEMGAIRSNPRFSTQFDVHELLEHFAEYSLRGLVPQSYKLLEFILTLPYLPASRQKGGVSKLEDIEKLSYCPGGIGIPSGEVSFLSVECELLRSLRQTQPFYDDVLARFQEVNKTIPLVQI